MAPKFIRTLSIVILLATAFLALPAPHVYAASSHPADAALPALDTFAGSLKNGQASQLRGVYVPDILADTVVQQPANQADFVSPRQNIITQFSSATTLGSTGLLAHNFLAGAKFSQMQAGQTVYLVYGDGRTAAFTVTTILRYQALQPNSVYSDFKDLSSGRTVSASSLFSTTYGRRGAVVFQTCINSNGLSTWGRLFVIASPAG